MSDLLNSSITSTGSSQAASNEVSYDTEPINTSFDSTAELLNYSKTNLFNQNEQEIDQYEKKTIANEELIVTNNNKDDVKNQFNLSRTIEEINIENNNKNETKNQSNLILPRTEDLEEINEESDTKKQLKLIIPKPSFQIVNDITKIQIPDVKRNSAQFVFPCQDMIDISVSKQNQTSLIEDTRTTNDLKNKQKQIRPIMGKNALLKKANIDPGDSLIIQDIVLDKYNPVLNHYVTRMYHRRLSRSRLNSSCDDDFYSDMVFSSTASCSPISISSIGSEPQGFTFPSLEELDKEQSNIQIQRQSRRQRVQRTESFRSALLDNICLESSNLNNTTYSCSVISNEGTTWSEYDPDKFIKNAIGDVTAESGIYKQMPEKLTSTKCDNSTMGSADVSMLVSKLSSFYSSVKKGIRKKRSSLKTNQFTPNGTQILKPSSDNPRLDNLKRDLSIQNEIIFQVSKALVYCRSSKDFLYSTEHVEAEKILLVALIAKEELISEINGIEFNNYQNKTDPRTTGEIEISGIKFLPNEHNFDVTNEHDQDIIREFFLVVVCCGNKVIASKVLTADEKGCLDVDKIYVFKHLSADFEISLSIYSMLVKDRAFLSQETLNCPTPKNLFHFQKDSKKTYKVLEEVPYIKTSAFRLLGRCAIRNGDLSRRKQQSLNLHDCPIHSRISPGFTAKITSNVNLDVRISGFLTVGIENEQSCTIWNRRWCVLENRNLSYWNYPSEEAGCPLGVVDLTFCIEQKIRLADRTSCARSKTLLVPIKSGDTVKKYLLSADSGKDVEMWEKELNFVIKNLTTWNCMN